MNRLVIAIVIIVLGTATVAQGKVDRWQIPSEVDLIILEVQKDRTATGVIPLERRDILDQVAAGRAEAVAARPVTDRLNEKVPIGVDLREAGLTDYRRASTRLIMIKNIEPVSGVLERWRGHEDAWEAAMSPEFHAVGVGSARSEDGWFIFVALLLEDSPVFDDLPALEKAAFEKVNQVRVEYGLQPMDLNKNLSKVARRHSEDMATRDFMAHRNPDGLNASDRVRKAGISCFLLAENLHSSTRALDPVKSAVEGWMNSPGHRENILTAEYTMTGMGVAIGKDGTVYFTQLFMRPPR